MTAKACFTPINSNLPHQILHLDFRVPVLMLFACGLFGNLHGLLGTVVEAGKTHGASVTDEGFFICQCDIALGADLAADAAADAFVGIDSRKRKLVGAPGDNLGVQDPAKRVEAAEMQAFLSGREIGDNLFQAGGRLCRTSSSVRWDCGRKQRRWCPAHGSCGNNPASLPAYAAYA